MWKSIRGVTKVDILSYIKNRQDSSLEVMSKDQQDIPSHAFSNEEDKIEMDHGPTEDGPEDNRSEVLRTSEQEKLRRELSPSRRGD